MSTSSLTRRDDAPSLASRGRASRYGFIDSIRGIAACLVLLQHSLYQSGLLGPWPNERLTGFIPNWLELGETGVVAFFLVSGFVIPFSLEKTNDFKLFWIHRALRIYPLYLLVFILTAALERGGDIHTIGGLLTIVSSHLLFLQEYLGHDNFVGGSWTLSLEMVWYIAISGLFLVSLNARPVLLVSLSLLISLLAQITCIYFHHLPMGRLSMLLCCVFGFICYRREHGDLQRNIFLLLSICIGTAITLNLLVGFGLFPDANPTASFRTVIGSWTLAAFIFFIPYSTRTSTLWNNPILLFLGRISYSVYLLHAVLLYLFAQLHVQGFLLICLVVPATIAAATLTYRYIELPPIRYGHGFKKQYRTSAHKLGSGIAI